MKFAAFKAEIPGIFRLAVPIVAGLSASTLIGVTDSIMLAPLGPLPLAAAGLTGAVALVLYAAIYGMLSVLSVRIGAAFGAGRGRRIPQILRSGLVLGLMVGIGGAATMGAVFFALPWLGQPDEVIAILPGYWLMICLMMIPFSVLTVFKSAFEAVNRPWVGTGFAFLAVLINIPLNYALIWGIGPLPELGLTGAGLASLAAESLALLAAWVFWSRAASMRRLRLRRPVSFQDIAETAREGAPLGALYIAETGAMAAAVALIGTFGVVALAANQVAQSVGSLLYMLPLGVAGAVAIRVAQEKGAGNLSALRPIVSAALGLAMIWLCTAALILFFFGENVAGLITTDPEVIRTAASIFVIFAMMQVADGVQSIMLGALRGMSDTTFPAVVSMAAYWALALPLGWVLANSGGFGPAGIWLGFFIALVLAGGILTIRFVTRTGSAELA
jgi:MATE family multidrug resistance protein